MGCKEQEECEGKFLGTRIRLKTWLRRMKLRKLLLGMNMKVTPGVQTYD